MTPWELLNQRMAGPGDYIPSLKFLHLADPAAILGQYGLNAGATNAGAAYGQAVQAGALPLGWSSATGQPTYAAGGTAAHVPLSVTGTPWHLGQNGPNTFFPPNGGTGGQQGSSPGSIIPATPPPPATNIGGHGVIGTGTGVDTGRGGVTGVANPPPSTVGGQTTTSVTPAISTPGGPSVSPVLSTPQGGGGAAAPVDYSKLFNPTQSNYDGNTVGYDATTSPTLSGVMPTAPNMAGGGLNPTSIDPTATGSATSAFPTGAQTLGQPMYPWLSAYQGNFTAPMTPYQNQGLNGISDYVGSGENLGGAQGYLANVLSGQYLDPSTNPNLAKYVSSLSGIHDYQDQLENQRIGSSMAAGGDALSGARAMAQSQYQNESNNQYQNMIASMLNSNYQMERGLQNSAVPLQMGLSNELMGGYGQLMSAGAVPQQTQQAENNAEYQDWLRQISGMQQAYQAPQNEMEALLHSGYPGSSAPTYQGSDASSLMAALLGNGSGSSGLINALFGSGTTGGSSGGLLGSLGSLLGIGGGSTGSGSSSSTSAGNGFGFSSNGSDLSSLMGSGYDPNNAFGFSSNGNDLAGLMSMYGDGSGSGTDAANYFDPTAGTSMDPYLLQLLESGQTQGNP